MRHRRHGRTLGRNSSHRRALLRNLASSLFLTERSAEYYEDLTQPDGKKVNPPTPGRIVTTLQKAKEVRPLIEKCITIARRSLEHSERADELETDAKRGSDEWKEWRKGKGWQEWNQAMAPAVAARRHALRLLGNREAVEILFDEIAPRFRDRDGGYTRILRLAKPRLGDAGTRALLEFVGVHDRVVQRSEKPAFREEPAAEKETPAEEEPAEEVATGGANVSAEPQDEPKSGAEES